MNPASDSFSVTLRRDGPGQPWGFRLQGGVNFTTALSIQSVNTGSIAARAGLQAGDAVLQINGRPSDELGHEQAKREIITSGDKVFLVVQRGAVKIWKPRVTPMSELRPKEMNLRPNGTTADEIYIQKTSLAANKPAIHHVGIGYNRTAKPFGSASLGARSGGGDATIPTVVIAHHNAPTGMCSTKNALDNYQAQSAALTGRMQDLTVSKAKPSVVGPSPAFLTVQGNDNKGDQKRSTSPNFLTTNVQRSRSPVFRNVSPIRNFPPPAFLTVQGNDNKTDQKRSTSPNFLTTNVQRSRSRSPVFRNISPIPNFRGQGLDNDGSEVDKTSMFNQVLHQMEESKDAKEGEENLHQGTSNPHRQSRTFQLLEKGLAKFEAEQEGSSADNSGTRQPVIRSVKAPVSDPSQHEVHQAQHMTCKICGSLIIGVFVHINGQQHHPECFKCCRCGKNLKNQGCFDIEGQMYCEVHAKDASRSESGQGKYTVPIYR